MTAGKNGITWQKMVRYEPRLKTLSDEIRRLKDDKSKPSFCANLEWQENFRPRLLPLVGWGAKVSLLRTSKAYDLAYRKLYDDLPDCRNCQCLEMTE